MLKRLVGISSGLLFASMLAGCSANFAPSPITPEETPIGTIQGNVHGGNFPVTGAQIYLFAAGQGGYGTSATSLLRSGASGVICSNAVVSGACYVTTDPVGNFSVGGEYTCTEGQQVYMVSVGGNPGLSGNVNNTAIAQMAALGSCPSTGTMAQQVPFLVINEVTTVAFAYAMGGFATTPYNVSSDVSGETALANALANANNIVTLAKGQAPAVVNGNSNSVNPQSRINTLANILATCVNTTSSSSSECASLFKYATTSSGTQATDEASAIFNIVHNQAMQIVNGTSVTQNATNLYNLMNGNEPFSPYLASAPSDWTMPVIYKSLISTPKTVSSVITSGPYNIAFDAEGDAWIGDRVNGVVKIQPQGAVTTFSNASKGFSMVKGVAVSPQDGNIWVSDFGNNKVYVMSPSGTIGSTITQHMTSSGPVSTVFALNPIPTSPAGDYMAYEVDETVVGIVTLDAGSPYTALHYTGNANGGTNYSNVSSPGWTYVDSTGSVWIPSTNTYYAGELIVSDKSGTVGYGASDLYMGAAYTTVPEQLGMAADGLANVWAATTISGYGTALYELKGGGLTGTVTGGGLNNPYKTFVDGSNAVWVANGGANTVSGYNAGATTPAWLSSGGFSTGATSGTGCVVLAVDPSGNVWTGNSDQTVTQLLGLATPTAAPLIGGRTVIATTTTTTNGNLGTRP